VNSASRAHRYPATLAAPLASGALLPTFAAITDCKQSSRRGDNHTEGQKRPTPVASHAPATAPAPAVAIAVGISRSPATRSAPASSFTGGPVRGARVAVHSGRHHRCTNIGPHRSRTPSTASRGSAYWQSESFRTGTSGGPTGTSVKPSKGHSCRSAIHHRHRGRIRRPLVSSGTSNALMPSHLPQGCEQLVSIEPVLRRCSAHHRSGTPVSRSGSGTVAGVPGGASPGVCGFPGPVPGG
jgi:hypothetical protein